VLSGAKSQFVIAPRRVVGMMQPMGLHPTAFNVVEQALRSSPDIEMVDSIGPKGGCACTLRQAKRGKNEG
jgi:hypothetical protein